MVCRCQVNRFRIIAADQDVKKESRGIKPRVPCMGYGNSAIVISQINQVRHSYAYDVYFLQCALHLSCPLITLDTRMKQVAYDLNIKVLE